MTSASLELDNWKNKALTWPGPEQSHKFSAIYALAGSRSVSTCAAAAELD